MTLVRIKDKFEEASILQRFRNNYLGFPLGKITQLNNPDVVIEGDLTVGIEITQVSKDQDSPTGSFVRSKEVFKRNVLENVVSHLSTSTFPKCILSIDFDDKIFSEKLNSRTIALECYEKIISESKNFQNPGIYEIENIGDLPEITESYSLYINESIDSTTYIETAASTLPELTNIHIQYILDKKEKAKINYMYCNFYWLIIKEGSFEADSFSRIQIDKSQLKTTFDKVFIIRQYNSEIIELK